MKNKPVKHKSTNTFKFVPFAERINAIDIRHAALYHIEHANSAKPEENETHFYITIRKWHGLNLTVNYKKYVRENYGIVTVPQLLHKKEFVLETLEKYLLLDDPLCIQPLLEILVSLAKDLREDFYPYFSKYLDILIKFLDSKNADILEWALICLAFLFKILKPYLKKDIAVVLRRIVPLLSESKPQFINNFAAESFAFVARDIRDKKIFLVLILNYLQDHEDAIAGCGHLMFEILRGVNGKFHSCMEVFLPLLLQQLKENKKHQHILFQILTQTFTDSLQTIHLKEYSIFWDCIVKYAEEILADNDNESKGLEHILRLAGQVVEHQKGKCLTNAPVFVLLLIKIICEQHNENVIAVCAQIGALLLLSPNVSLSQEHASIIVKVLLPLPFPDVLISFVQNVIDYSQFDFHILPQFLNFVVQSNFETEAMSTLTKVCLTKSPPCLNGIKLFEWVKYPIDFGRGLPLFMSHLSSVIDIEDIESCLENPVRCVNALVCLSHVEKLNVDHCINLLSQFIEKLFNLLCSNVDKEEVQKTHSYCTPDSASIRRTLFILGHAIECAVHISSCRRLQEITSIEKLLPILLPCAANPNYLAALHIVDLYLTAYECENGLTYTHLKLVDSFLKDNIKSPFHIVRLLTTHIYKLFENVEEMKKTIQIGNNTEVFSVFSLCYSVESVAPSIQEYRTQLNMLQRMTFNTSQYNLSKNTDYSLYALNYMLGILYAKFKLLWEPVIEFIAGYANALTHDEFWPIFYKSLETSFDNANTSQKQYIFDNEIDSSSDILNNIYKEYNSIFEKPDFCHYRNLMLKIMTQCIHVCEAKNRDVVILFLNFIEHEYKRNDTVTAINTDVELHIPMETDDTNGDITEIEELEDKVEDEVCGKIAFKTVINIMEVLAQFKNPRALHKEPVFWEMYMDFLKHKNPGLQKYALDCVMNYKNKSVIAYKSNLYNLVDEKKFKDELTMFKITEDSEVLRSEDREHVMPIILRVLYGKMITKLGPDKKSGGQTRRALVMRYLAGCKESEFKMFIEMAFPLFSRYMTMNPRDIHDDIVANLNLKSIIGPGKLHSVLNLFEVIREYFGGYLKDKLFSEFCKILYSVLTTIAAVLAQNEKVHVSYIKTMKNLRTVAMSIVRKLFEQFDKYPWSKEELYVIFETLIWPTLPKLYIEGIHSPTMLLKLLSSWCQNPRFYILLITTTTINDSEMSPLPALFRLLLSPKTNVSVTNMILDMIEKLLTLSDENEDQEVLPIESFNTLPILENEKTLSINFGSKILIPHIPSILDIMKRRLANSAKTATVNKRDLLILSRITELVVVPDMCDDLLNLLLPILVKKVCMNMAEENMEYSVTTIINLLQNSANPQKYIKTIAVLFNKVSPVDVRKLLCKLLISVSENSDNNENLTRLAKVVNEMNAFNKRWIEQPDFDRRLDAYKEIYKLSENDKIDTDLAILIVNNCFYFMRTEKDIGLRDSAGLCLKKILPKLLLQFKSTNEGQFLVRDTVLSLLSTSIKDTKNDILRNESIALLGEFARECPEADVVLSDLANLINKEDKEVDFFENMCHLQMHRRVRALLKFCKTFKKVTKTPTPRTLTNFILPLASMYLCDDKYSDKNTLIDAAIEVVSTCCRLLPWYHYEVILKYYLNKMRHTTEHQKQLTRILIGIVDAFHFDFSKVPNLELPKALISSMRNNDKKKNVDKNNVETKTDLENSENVPNENKENDDEVKDLDTDLQEADEEETENNVTTEPSNIPAFQRITIVSPSIAKRIIKSLTQGLIPQMNRSIGKLSEQDDWHRTNKRRQGFERQIDELQRVPLALALTVLLQRLPEGLLHHHLPGIIIKLCSFLKSPLKQVRITARDIVKKIMVTVGTTFLGMLLEHLKLLLTRGFQVHVLVSTIHSVLDALKNNFKVEEFDHNLKYILDVCCNDLFGALSEEKEVDKLHYKTPEAKPSKKSFVTLTIAAQNISDKSLIDLIIPFKEVLQKHHSKKIVLKVQEALKHISTGLVTNKFIKSESLFIFLHGIASESIPEFVLGAPKRELTEKQREIMLRAKPDCYIIPVAPKRNREVQAKYVKTSANSNFHVLVEFSLNILYVILKREKVPKVDCKAFVDPIVPLLVDSLRSDHVRVTTVALKCITTLWTIRIVTQNLENNIKEVVQALFTILHKYATFEITKQNDNYHLVRNAFKAVTVLIRNVKYYKMEADQLKTLLLYAEGDCQNDDRQSNCFALLKAILEARLVSTELHEVMEKISNICVLSDSARSRDEARLIFVTYLSNYSPGKKLDRHIQFFVSQLNYEMKHGRLSSLKFLQMIISKLQKSQLSQHSGFLFLSLGTCMVNDSDPECRESAAVCLQTLIGKFEGNERNQLFKIVLTFFQDSRLVHLELAAQLCTRFVVVEEELFKNRLPIILPILISKLQLLNNVTEGKFVKPNLQLDENDNNDNKNDEERQKEKDHCLIQILNLIEKIGLHCSSNITNEKFINDFDDIAQQCQTLLAYPHTWVRLKSAKIINQMLLYVEGEKLENIIKGKIESDRGFLYYDTENTLRSLVLDLCAQYTAGITKEMADEVTAILFQIIKLIHSISYFKTKEPKAGDLVEMENSKLNFRWIMYKLRKAISVEVAKSPTCNNVRTAIFTMWMHLISLYEAEDMSKVIDLILAPIVRELSVNETHSTAERQLASRVGKKLRRKFGDLEYSKLVAIAQTRLNVKRAERKKIILQEKVNNPDKAAKRKLQVKEKKKQSKKIKLEMLKGKRPRPKKRKMDDVDIEDSLLE